MSIFKVVLANILLQDWGHCITNFRGSRNTLSNWILGLLYLWNLRLLLPVLWMWLWFILFQERPSFASNSTGTQRLGSLSCSFGTSPPRPWVSHHHIATLLLIKIISNFLDLIFDKFIFLLFQVAVSGCVWKFMDLIEHDEITGLLDLTVWVINLEIYISRGYHCLLSVVYLTFVFRWLVSCLLEFKISTIIWFIWEFFGLSSTHPLRWLLSLNDLRWFMSHRRVSLWGHVLVATTVLNFLRRVLKISSKRIHVQVSILSSLICHLFI